MTTDAQEDEMMDLITRSDDERLMARVYDAGNEGMIRALRDMDILASSLRAALTRLALLEKACQIALTVGTAYPSDTSARMDSHTEAVLRAALKSAGPKEG